MADAGEASPEGSGEGRWLTHSEISQVYGIGRESVVKLVRREKWRKQPGNDGAVRVLVPSEWLRPARERSPGSSPDSSPEASRNQALRSAACGKRLRP